MSAVVRKPAPDFSGEAVDGSVFKDIKLSDYKGKYLVLFSFPLAYTFVCTTELTEFSDRLAEFKDINCEVVTFSVDSKYTLLSWAQAPRSAGGVGTIKYPIMSDLTHKVSKAYGVYDEEAGHTLRGLFIIDDKGILRHSTVNDFPVGRSVDETLRLVKAFQFTDKHGEVCPVNWKPGSATIKPDPVGKLEYFSKKK